MKQNKFLILNAAQGDLVYHINHMMITSITEYQNFRMINTMGGQSISVRETIEEITSKIQECEKFKLITT
jgi:hypothetical protein